MWRLLIGLVVGIAGGAAVSLLNTDGYTLSAPLVALGAGLALGILLGWKREGPRRALGGGMVAGGLAGLLIAASQLAGAWQALANPLAPYWLRGLNPNGVLFWALAVGLAALCLLLVIAPAGALAGVTSAWTGFRPVPRRTPRSAGPVRPAVAIEVTPIAQTRRAAAAPTRPTTPHLSERPTPRPRSTQPNLTSRSTAAPVRPAEPSRPHPSTAVGRQTRPVLPSIPSQPPQRGEQEPDAASWLLPGFME